MPKLARITVRRSGEYARSRRAQRRRDPRGTNSIEIGALAPSTRGDGVTPPRRRGQISVDGSPRVTLKFHGAPLCAIYCAGSVTPKRPPENQANASTYVPYYLPDAKLQQERVR